eukprot:CAMPEP_0168379532 /NCGR_PEP_ID=MMETSP0228-20121227/11893_1 /TAXON_ID=133427 /ORGANISM="Protoceratium reticulatum, Strain CCCM 535 (=CCMP 1889)" /LENGTH=162 /DNA_ID=CAMNT_0008392569 /DNA_START=400 /DNA_END=883 /DNA_ORIENTATION=+
MSAGVGTGVLVMQSGKNSSSRVSILTAHPCALAAVIAGALGAGRVVLPVVVARHHPLLRLPHHGDAVPPVGAVVQVPRHAEVEADEVAAPREGARAGDIERVRLAVVHLEAPVVLLALRAERRAVHSNARGQAGAEARRVDQRVDEAAPRLRHVQPRERPGA